MNEKKTTAELLAKLKGMASKAGEALFERASMAVDVLSDPQWVADNFGGNTEKARRMIADECFPDLSMANCYDRLLTLREKFTDISVWRQHKFNLDRLWIMYEEEIKRQTLPPARPAIPYKKQLEEVTEEKDAAEFKLRKANEERERLAKQAELDSQQAKKAIQTKDQRIAELEGTVAQLQVQIGTLNEKLSEKEIWIKAQDERIAELEDEVYALRDKVNGKQQKRKEAVA